MTLLTLADEILTMLTPMMREYPRGPNIKQVAAHMAADRPSVRIAFFQLEKDGRAKIAKRGPSLHLLPIDDPTTTCIICRKVFEQHRHPCRRKSTCSRSCAHYLAWRNPDMRARHKASVRAAQAVPERRQKMSEKSRAYYATPEARARLAENNRRGWADPATRARRLNGIDRAWTDQKRRKIASKRRKADWKNDAFREKTVKAMREGKRAKSRLRIVALARAHPHMNYASIGEIVGRSPQSVAIVLQRARKLGEISVRPGDHWRVALNARKVGQSEAHP